ncbi:MAG: LuxR C-terminal-related transcriptional regulator, partial [Nitrospinae bacterium]|nr:LuxR C-terminal-related transcriptional regulator [Nitrospinota bacterium]
ILASMHEAALDDTRWPAASKLIDDALGVHGNTLAFGDLHSGKNIQIYFLEAFSHGQRLSEFEREYFEDYYPLDERVHHVRQLPDSQVVSMSKLYTEKELKVSVVYNDYLTRLHAQNGIAVRLDGPDRSSIGWGVHDPLNGAKWSSTQLNLIRRLLPHIRQFVSFRQALSGAGALGASLMELLDTTGSGIIQLDRRGRIVEVNDRARDLLRAGDGLFDERGFLFARTPEENDHLQGLLARALPPSGAQGVGGSMMVMRASGLPLALHVNPVARQESDFRAWPVAALVLVADPESRIRIDPAMAAEALGLTKMESRVAVLLAEGRSVAQIAAAFGRKESTIRTHVKHIFAKHGLTRQVDLVRLVLSLANTQESRD